MPETKRQIKDRLQAAGLWKDYLALREQLALEGRRPRQAREEALRQVDSRPPQPQTSADQPAGNSPNGAPLLKDVVAPPQPACPNPRCLRIGMCICEGILPPGASVTPEQQPVSTMDRPGDNTLAVAQPSEQALHQSPQQTPPPIRPLCPNPRCRRIGQCRCPILPHLASVRPEPAQAAAE